jgi:hypothetical protein
MAGRFAEKLVLSLVLIGAAAIALMAACGLLAAAFYLWLLTAMEPPQAAFLTGLLVLGFAALFFALSRAALKAHSAVPHAHPAPATGDDAKQQEVQMISALAGEEIGKFLHEKPKSATGIALAAGLAIGLSPELRHTLGSFLAPEKR